jgi:hypothetical protein
LGDDLCQTSFVFIFFFILFYFHCLGEIRPSSDVAVVQKLQFESQLQFLNCTRDMLDGLLPMQAALNFAETESSLHADVCPIVCQLTKFAFIIFNLVYDFALCFCYRAMDIRTLVMLGTASSARTVVRDTGKEVLALTLFSPRGPGFAFSYSGTGCGQKSMQDGNLSVVPGNIDPALLRQYPLLHVRTPVREIHRYLMQLFPECMCACSVRTFFFLTYFFLFFSPPMYSIERGLTCLLV